MDLKLAPKLTEQHINENHYNKMKVNCAKNVINRDVSAGLNFFSRTVEMKIC